MKHNDPSFKIEIYMETSVPNAYLDSAKPERQLETQAFWKRLPGYQVYISDFVVKEIQQTPQQSRRDDLLALVKPFEQLHGDREDVNALAHHYVTSGVIAVPADAKHLAIAVTYNIGVLVSWNYRHLVKLKTKRAVNALHLIEGYAPIEIVDPSML